MEKIKISSESTIGANTTNISQIANEISNKNLKENEYFCFNLRQLSKHLEIIRKIFIIHKDEKNYESFFNINIFYFKRLSKERTTFQIYINELRFSIIYEFLSLSLENKKRERKELIGNFIEEIIEKFQPLLEIKLFSDNLNPSGNYTAKHLINDCSNLKILELNNFVFHLNLVDNKNYMNENVTHFKKFPTNVENLTLNFQFNEKNSGNNFMKNFNFLIQNLILKNSQIKNINLVIYHDDYIDLTDNNGQLISDLFFDNNSSKNIIYPYGINELKFTFVNTNTKSKKILSKEELVLLSISLMYKFSSEFLEINFVEILSSENSKLEKDVSIFKFSKIIYTKKFFCLLNSLKIKFFGNHGKENKNLNYQNNKNILKLLLKFLNLKDEDIFEIKTHHLQLMLPKESKKKMNSTKFLFNLIQDYESALRRKVKYEEIFQMITSKPHDDDENIKRENKIKFKKYDLNSISKILSKIEGNNFLFLKDGRKISIGGKFKTMINQIEYSLGLNTILEINKLYSNLRIFTFKDNYFLSTFHAAAEILDEEQIIIVGGISIPELLPNFADTPIYKLNVNSFEITRVLPSLENKFYPGVIFNHKIKIYGNNFIEVSEGFVIANYSGGLNILPGGVNLEKPRVEQNTKAFIYDLKNNVWQIKSNENEIKI